MNWKSVRHRIAIIRTLLNELEAEADRVDRMPTEENIAKAKKLATESNLYWREFLPDKYKKEPKGQAFVQRRAMLIREEALAMYKEDNV